MGSKKNKRKSAEAGSVATEIRSVNQAPRYSVGSKAYAGKAASWSTKYFEWLALGVASVLSYWILTARLVGVNVSVLVDEYSYVLDTHYKALSETAYPNHLFQLVYSVTKNCGPEFYSCARSLNAIFVIGSGVILYFFAKYMSQKYWLAAAAFVVTVFGSMGTYTAYFMPEAIFNFFMVAFFYALTRYSLSNNLLVWAGMGALLGLASLAKPHAFFIVPALIVYIILLTRATKTNLFLTSAKRLAASGLSLVGTKFAIGFAIAGERGVSVFGSYGGAISSGEAVATTLGVNTWMNVPVTAWGQILMITMILGFSFAVGILGLLESLKKDRDVFLDNRFRSLFTLSLLNMMAVVAVFEAWQNLTNWMHTRYNSYLIPLAIIVLIEAYINSDREAGRLPKRLVLAGFVSLSAVALVTAAIPYGANWVDAPDFKSHIDNFALSSFAILVAISLSVWWLWNSNLPMVAGVVFMVASSVFSGSHITAFLTSNFGQDSTHDHLGRVLRDFMPQDELDKTVLIGDNNTAMERVLFGAMTGGARLALVGDAGFDAQDLSGEEKWLVRIGEPLLRGLEAPYISGVGFELYSLSQQNSLQPRKSDVFSISSLCANKAWSCGGEVKLELAQRNATEFDLVFEVSELGASGNLEFRFGDSVLTGQIGPGISAIYLRFPSGSEGDAIQISAVDTDISFSPTEEFVRIISINSVR